MSKSSKEWYHNKSSPFIVFLFSCWHLSLASLVINEINSDTHSWMLSLDSFAILALFGSTFFIIRAIFAMGKYLHIISWIKFSTSISRLRVPVLLPNFHLLVLNTFLLSVAITLEVVIEQIKICIFHFDRLQSRSRW